MGSGRTIVPALGPTYLLRYLSWSWLPGVWVVPLLTVYESHHEWYSIAFTDDMKRMIVVIETGQRHDPFKDESFV